MRYIFHTILTLFALGLWAVTVIHVAKLTDDGTLLQLVYASVFAGGCVYNFIDAMIDLVAVKFKFAKG